MPAPSILGPLVRTPLVQKWLKGPDAERRLKEMARETFSDPARAKKRYRKARKFIYPSMPFFHDASYANIMMGALSGTMMLVLPDSVKFDPALVLSMVEKEKITNMANVPTGWKKLVDFPDAGRFDPSSIRMTAPGGGVCPVLLKKQILKVFPNAMILDVFGQTEMTPPANFLGRLDSMGTIEEAREPTWSSWTPTHSRTSETPGGLPPS